MPTAKVTPNVVTYSALISACEKKGQWPAALCLFEEMPSAKVTPNAVTYTALISACEKKGQWQAALCLFEEMPEAKLGVSNVAYNALLNSAQICNSKLGGYIFRFGYLPMLSSAAVFGEVEIDLHALSEGVCRRSLTKGFYQSRIQNQLFELLQTCWRSASNIFKRTKHPCFSHFGSCEELLSLLCVGGCPPL